MAYSFAAAALLDSISSAIPAHDKDNTNTRTVQRAASLIEKANKMASKESRSDSFLLLILQFNIALRHQNTQEAMRVVDQVQHCTTSSRRQFALLEMTLLAHRINNKQVQKAALAATLHVLTSNADINYKAVGGIVRSLYECCANDEKLHVLQEFVAMIKATAANCAHNEDEEQRNDDGGIDNDKNDDDTRFAVSDVKYFFTKAWNQGAMHARFQRVEQAKEFMTIAIQILDHVAAPHHQVITDTPFLEQKLRAQYKFIFTNTTTTTTTTS